MAIEGAAILRLAGAEKAHACSIVREEFPRVVLSLSDPAGALELSPGARALLVENRVGQSIARSGQIATVAEGMVAFEIQPGQGQNARPAKLVECQLPAMVRTRSRSGHFGGWKGAIIIKHSPNRLHLQIEEGQVVPEAAELLFSPIGGDATRMYGEEGGVMNAADVRSRRIRVRALIHDVMAGDPGTVTLVVDISRTLYRAA